MVPAEGIEPPTFGLQNHDTPRSPQSYQALTCTSVGSGGR